MGQSTDALLYYGFSFLGSDEEEDAPWYDSDTDDHEVEDWLFEELSGKTPPNVEFETGKENKEWHQWWQDKRDFLKTLPVEVIIHCSCDYPIYAICMKESLSTAYRGRAVKLDKSITSEHKWDSILREYCEKPGIDWQEPSWELASLWC